MILLIFAIGWNYVCCLVALNLDDFRFFLLMLKVAWSFQVRIVLSFCRSFWSWSQTSWASLYFRTKNQYQIWLSLCTRFNRSDIICLIFDSHRSQQVEKTFILGRLFWEFKKLFLLYELILIFFPFLLELRVWLPSFASWSITHLLKVSMLLWQWVPVDKKILCRNGVIERTPVSRILGEHHTARPSGQLSVVTLMRKNR